MAFCFHSDCSRYRQPWVRAGSGRRPSAHLASQVLSGDKGPGFKAAWATHRPHFYSQPGGKGVGEGATAQLRSSPSSRPSCPLMQSALPWRSTCQVGPCTSSGAWKQFAHRASAVASLCLRWASQGTGPLSPTLRALGSPPFLLCPATLLLLHRDPLLSQR